MLVSEAVVSELMVPCLERDPTELVVVLDEASTYAVHGSSTNGRAEVTRLSSLAAISSIPRRTIPPVSGRPPVGSAVSQLFSWISRLGDDACGAIRVFREGEMLGSVFAERARICWASAPAMNRRLSDLLRAKTAGFDADMVEHVIRWCRRTGEAFGESLVRSGALTPEGLCSALRQQTAEAIALMCEKEPLRMTWIPRRHGYDASFTFSAIELLVEIGRLEQPNAASRAVQHLQRMLKSGGSGVASVDGMPIAAVRTDDWEPASVEQLSRWAFLLVSAAGDSVVGAVSRHGRSVVAWKWRGAVYACTTEPRLLPLRLAGVRGTLRVLSSLSDTDSPPSESDSQAPTSG